MLSTNRIIEYLNEEISRLNERKYEVIKEGCPGVGKKDVITHIGGAIQQTKRILKYIETIKEKNGLH